MNNFSDIICSHPGFHITKVADDRLVLVSETESFLLKGNHYLDLFHHMDGLRTMGDIVSTAPDFQRQILMLNTIDDLTRKGLILKKNRRDEFRFYHPDFSSGSMIWQCRDGRVEIRLLTETGDLDMWDRWAGQLRIDEPMGLVIVDDYLDPRLIEINRLYAKDKKKWLLIKPTGKRPLIGPCFMQERPDAPCVHCLSQRFLSNQPVRQWLRKMLKNSDFVPPVAFEKGTLKDILPVILKPAQDLIRDPGGHALYSLDTKTMTITEHPVTRLPHCPGCGEPGMFSENNSKPVILKSSPKVHMADGGVRAVSPLKTLERLRTSISPITGIIADLSLLPDQKDSGVPIFRTCFFKTPTVTKEPENSDFMQISLGKGMSAEQSMASAICESMERVAVQYRGDETQTFSTIDHMKGPVVLPGELAAFSDNQYRNFEDSFHPENLTHYGVKPYHSAIPIHWTPAWSLTDNVQVHLPLTFCYANTPYDEFVYSRFSSNGCAAGNTLEEALLQGFLELVERDAVAVWWYNRINRPGVSLGLLSQENHRLITDTLAEEWEYWVLDLTHDLEIPVMAAVARHKVGHTFRLGFGCHINPVIACQRALTELCQLIAIKNRGPSVFDFDAIKDEPFLFPDQDPLEKHFSDYAAIVHADIRDDVQYCIEKAALTGLSTLVVDYTRPDIPIHTVRAIVPGLAHIWPQLGNSRLYSVPVTMGWQKAPLTEEQLNPQSLLI